MPLECVYYAMQVAMEERFSCWYLALAVCGIAQLAYHDLLWRWDAFPGTPLLC